MKTAAIPRDKHAALNIWASGQGKLEDELYLCDFYREDPNYDPREPLVYCLTGGLIAFVTLEGLDPEPFGFEVALEASDAVKRALDNFSPENVEPEFRGGQWEVINYFVRRPGVLPALVKPVGDNQSLHYLWQKSSDYWRAKETYDDQIVFALHYFPKFATRKDLLKMRDPLYHAVLVKDVTERLSRFVKRIAKSFIEDLSAFHTQRPKMGLRPRYMTESEVYAFLYAHVNKRFEAPSALDPDLPLLTQVCLSERGDNSSILHIRENQTVRKHNVIASFRVTSYTTLHGHVFDMFLTISGCSRRRGRNGQNKTQREDGHAQRQDAAGGRKEAHGAHLQGPLHRL